MSLMLATAALLALGALLYAEQSRAHRAWSALEERCLDAFDSAYSGVVPKPAFRMFNSFGHPAFELSYESPEQFGDVASQKALVVFSSAVQEICTATGSRFSPFDAKLAIIHQYPGRFDAKLSTTTRAGGSAPES